MCAVEIVIVVGWVVPSWNEATAWGPALILGALFLLFTGPVALVMVSGSLMRLLVRRVWEATVEPTEIVRQPRYYWPMEHYLQVRLGLRDWHGVMDAAADLRELEAKLQVVQEIDKEDGL